MAAIASSITTIVGPKGSGKSSIGLGLLKLTRASVLLDAGNLHMFLNTERMIVCDKEQALEQMQYMRGVHIIVTGEKLEDEWVQFFLDAFPQATHYHITTQLTER